MPSIFSKIVSGEIPCYKVAETDDCLAFLDIFPIAKGHTLVIPKMEVDYYFDLPDDLMTSLHLFAKSVAVGLKRAVPCERIGTSVIGLEVPHAHLHLIPINAMKDMHFDNPKLQFSEEEMRDLAESIASQMPV